MLKVKSKLLVIILVLKISIINAFDHSILIKNESFKDRKFNFSIIDVIDGRLNKEKPLGYLIKDFTKKKESIGNDSLDKQLLSMFTSIPSSFDTSLKVILVIDQVVIQESKNMNEDLFEVTLALDFYKSQNNQSNLLYQSFYRYIGQAGINKIKNVSSIFCEATMLSFFDFRTHLRFNYKPLSDLNLSKEQLYKNLVSKSEKIATSDNIKDGLYFNIKQLYLNEPSLLKDYSIPDTSYLGKVPVKLTSKSYQLNKGVYAIVNNKRIYLYLASGFYNEAKIDEKGDLALINIKRIGDQKGMMMAGMAFGLIGSLTYAAVKGDKINSKIYDKVDVDFETGFWVFD